MNRKTAVVGAVASAACFGSLAVLTTLAYERGAQPLQLLTWRFGLAVVLLGGYLALRKPQSLRVSLGDLGRFAILSFAGYGAASICFFFALTFAPAAVVGILLYTYPAIVTLAEWVFLGLRPAPSRLLAVLVAFSGCALVADPFGSQSTVAWPGVVLGIGAAVAYASFSIFSHRWLPGRTRSGLMAYMFLFTTVLAGGAALATGTSLSVSGWSADIWLLLAAIVAFPTFIAIVLYLAALRTLGASQAAVVSTFEPLFTIVFAAVLLGE
ncbi:MAG: DMT family transporter, partial [Coriobacteriia bacterium]|nr:DMT family transporter [Coriobacteriia bacterium]